MNTIIYSVHRKFRIDEEEFNIGDIISARDILSKCVGKHTNVYDEERDTNDILERWNILSYFRGSWLVHEMRPLTYYTNGFDRFDDPFSIVGKVNKCERAYYINKFPELFI